MKTESISNFMKTLAEAPVIAILRGVTPETVLPVCEALVAGGIRFIEVTLNSPDPIESIKRAADRFSDGSIYIGAGTVLAPKEVERVASAGGTYIISPNVDPAVIRRTKELGMISIPGFMTPSEAFVAVAAGADLVKCFPVGSLGPGYIKDLKAVLRCPILAVGGVSSDNVHAFLKSGAVGVGVGSSLYQANRSVDEIKRDTVAFMAKAITRQALSL